MTKITRFDQLTAKQLRSLASSISDQAHDMEFEREEIAEHQGYDEVGAYRALADYLEEKANGRDAEVKKREHNGKVKTAFERRMKGESK
jgi:hypothetical protein